jgi:hypothetical protein
MKEIKATEGMYLTQSAEVGDNRIFVTAIKGAKVNEADWREATLEEKEAFEKEAFEKENEDK